MSHKLFFWYASLYYPFELFLTVWSLFNVNYYYIELCHNNINYSITYYYACLLFRDQIINLLTLLNPHELKIQRKFKTFSKLTYAPLSPNNYNCITIYYIKI